MCLWDTETAAAKALAPANASANGRWHRPAVRSLVAELLAAPTRGFASGSDSTNSDKFSASGSNRSFSTASSSGGDGSNSGSRNSSGASSGSGQDEGNSSLQVWPSFQLHRGA